MGMKFCRSGAKFIALQYFPRAFMLVRVSVWAILEPSWLEPFLLTRLTYECQRRLIPKYHLASCLAGA